MRARDSFGSSSRSPGGTAPIACSPPNADVFSQWPRCCSLFSFSRDRGQQLDPLRVVCREVLELLGDLSMTLVVWFLAALVAMVESPSLSRPAAAPPPLPTRSLKDFEKKRIK